MRRILLAGLGSLIVLLAPAVAEARKPGDRNRNSIPDRWERSHQVTVKRDLARRDADKDGLSTYAEWRSHTNPRKADSDRDGRADGLEDGDRDGLANGFEGLARTDPGKRDSDGDRRADGREDADRDRLDNAAEARFGFLPRKADSDGDGTRDGDEHAGVLTAVSGRVLTIALAKGGTLTATLGSEADVTCDADPEEWNEPDDEDGGSEEDLDEGEKADLETGEDEDEAGEEEVADEDVLAAAAVEVPELEEEQPLDDCVSDLRPGTLIRSLELTAGPGGLVIDALEALER